MVAKDDVVHALLAAAGNIHPIVWVHSDTGEAERHCLRRKGHDQTARDFWNASKADGIRVLAAQRSWERAGVIITTGTATTRYEPSRQFVIAEPATRRP